MIEPVKFANRPRLGDADEVGRICGYSKRSVLRFSDRGLMPFGRKIGALRRWDLNEVEAWIAGGCKPIRTAGKRGV